MILKEVEIRVKDNGNGIPQKVVDKIFQPFFTTKPTGQGTGLGLSLSYDIIKAHGGEIKVETKEGEGAEFIIQLPKHRTFLHSNFINPIFFLHQFDFLIYLLPIFFKPFSQNPTRFTSHSQPTSTKSC